MNYLKGDPVWRLEKALIKPLTNQDEKPEQWVLQLLQESIEHYQQECENLWWEKQKLFFSAKQKFFLYNKTNRCTHFPNLFWLKNEPLHVSGSSSAHHQEFIHCALGHWYVIPPRPCSKAFFKPVWHTSVQVHNEWTPDDGQRNCPKHVEVHFLAKINLGN
jgi:hypothetical protein